MNQTDAALLALLRDALHQAQSADPGLDPEEWQALLRLAERHKLLPLTFDAACGLPSFRAALRKSLPFEGKAPTKGADEAARRQTEDPTEDAAPAGAVPGRPSSPTPDWRALAIQKATDQALRENEFLNLILGLQARGLDPVVMKGAVCRALWPKPLLRTSVDDDLLIPAGTAPAYHKAMLELGMTPMEPDMDLNREIELCYYRENTSLSVELNTCFFDPNSDALGDLNDAFSGVWERTVSVQVQDVTLQTLAPTDHLLFLILHAFKHFLSGGFGLRIVADVCLFARQYAEQIDFARIRAVCEEKRCERFTAAVFRIGSNYLDVPTPEAFGLPAVDETALLADILDAGLHGENIERIRSANLTIGSVAERNAGKAASGGLRKTLFPGRKDLTSKYPWLEKRPWLLPAAWACRFAGYLRDRGKYGRENPAAALRLGKERVALLKQYGVIDE